jgi:flagellar basal-body rod modification protein FlgD
MNTNMQTLIALQQTTAAAAALNLVGANVTVAGKAASLSNATGSPAAWSLSASAPATANITITSATGQTAYTGTLALSTGAQSFTWNGRGNNGVTWPDGSYTIPVNAIGANGQPVSVSTQVQGVVSAVHVSQTPPQLTVGGQKVPMSQIQSISR